MNMISMGGGNGRISPPKNPIRTVDSVTRKQNLRRVAKLFRPYWRKLLWLSSLIVLSAGLGIAPAFLTRDLINTVPWKGHPGPHFSIDHIYILVAGMVIIPLVTGVIGVAQTWSSNRVGQEVMHDLRASVYRHLQRLSLAFFTRTRTGEVQSRIANDIGGVDTVVTTTATSIASNVTTVIATAFALVFLDWRLALAAFALLPIFVLMTRKIGRVRREIASTKQGSLADISSLVEESLSVSGVLLGKTMGKSGELTDTFSSESRRLAELEMRQRMAGRWMMASIQATFSIMPALVYGLAAYLFYNGSSSISIGTLVAFTALQTRLFFPVGSLLNVQADVQTSPVCSSTSISRSTSTRSSTPPPSLERSSRVRSCSTVSPSPTRTDSRRCRTSASSPRLACASRSSVRRGRARRRSATSSHGCTTSLPARSGSTMSTCAS
jgi:ATP-binding cassette subfamily B protein